MPLSQTGSYSKTHIGITYRCQRIKRGLTHTHISMPIPDMVLHVITYQNPMS
ncbi:hypothetical protein F383_32274 [Gossypium arboreum]|uniref:Uncharacterized protein n=1 Tax=Gossypium arboreum TaxID=29729 RepID=A0A0B0PK98_GOSAR|nr:hypothetical protein F383_32274 [Gossypium arboreum]